MSDRYTGGILSGTAPTVTQQSANGVYTLSQELQYQGQGVWPAASQNPILQSLRFRNSAVAYMTRTPASASNRQTFTLSYWVKPGIISSSSINPIVFCAGNSSTRPTATLGCFLAQANNNVYRMESYNGSGYDYAFTTTQVFRDPSAWYHIVVAFDTTQATDTNRMKLYVNGTQVTSFSTTSYPSQNLQLAINNNVTHGISTNTYNPGSSGDALDGYLAEMNFIDGVQLTPSSFGTTDANGIWQPIPYTGAYGTNGFYLPFSNKTSTTTLGYDFSGNSNNWTTNNFSLTSGSTYDSMLDSPSNASSTISNYCVLNPLDCYDNPPTQGNLARIGVGHTGSPFSTCRGTIGVSSGKWYFEALNTGTTGSSGNNMIGVMTTTTSDLSDAYGGSTTSSYQDNGGLQGNNSTGTVSSSGNGDIIMIAFDVDTSKMWVGKNGTWMNSGNPVTGVGYVFSALPISPLAPQVSMYGNVGDTKGWILNFGQQPFSYTPPTGFNRLNTYNLPVPTIPAGNKLMDATLWTGNGSTQTITNTAGFYPDFTWIKQRSNTTWHNLYDSVRGATYALASNDTGGTDTRSTGLTAFNSNGFSLGSDNNANGNTNTYVGWQWNAGTGVTSSNTNGTITSTVSVNSTAGFSVVTYTGNGTAGATVGHGLGVTPSMIIVKGRSVNSNWPTWTSSTNGYNLFLNATDAVSSTNYRFSGVPTSTTFGISSLNDVNTSSATYVAYCFAPVAGYSAFGYYGGNLNADGPFVYTGFRPRFVMIKGIDGTGSWHIFDTARSPYNLVSLNLYPNGANADTTNNQIDILSNGFKIRSTDTDTNDLGISYLYMAFAENPFKIARAR